MCIVFDATCGRHCVASTCSTSLVPMPKASAPNAPCVEVWLSPQTIVSPGCVIPSSGPMMCTMPWLLAVHVEQRACRDSRQFLASASNCSRGVLVHDRQDAVLVCRDGMVHHRKGQVRPAHLAPGRLSVPQTPAAKCLHGSGGGRYRCSGLAGLFVDDVGLPNFVVQCSWFHMAAFCILAESVPGAAGAEALARNLAIGRFYAH